MTTAATSEVMLGVETVEGERGKDRGQCLMFLSSRAAPRRTFWQGQTGHVLSITVQYMSKLPHIFHAM